jgi:very-short-patch-repair endonuclease
VFTLCESGFERDMMRWLVEKGYRVQPQVGALGFRIDLVVEGANGNRLAVECDGDRFHGPAQWRDDMRRQRVLERVGWRFWRCFASNFYRDRDGVLGELVDTLSRIGIEPGGHDSNGTQANRYSEHRVIREEAPGEGIKEDTLSSDADVERPSNRTGVTIGSRVVLLFADDKRRLAVRLTDGKNDPDGGFLSINSALGKAVVGADEGEEVELSLDDGRTRIVLIELVEQPGGTLVAAADEPQMETIA